MALLVRVEGPDKKIQRMGYGSSPVRVGRNPLNELYLDHSMASQWHASFRFDEESHQVTVMDLGSTNGSFLNGERLSPRLPTVVTQNDILTIGSHKLSMAVTEVPLELLQLARSTSFDTSSFSGKATLIHSAGEGSDTNLGGEAQSGLAATMLAGGDGATSQIDEALRVVKTAVEKTRPAYEDYRRSWAEVLRQLAERLDSAPIELRGQIASSLVANYSQISREPEFQAVLHELGLGSQGSDEVDPVEWLSRLKYGVSSSPDPEPVNPRLAMERVGAILETFAQSLIALRRGYEQFGEEMGLAVAGDRNRLSEAKDFREVLRIVLDWNQDGGRVVEDVRRSFTDVAIHQVALLQGVMEGLRHLLEQISPESIAGGSSILFPKDHQGGLLSTVLSGGHRWKIYAQIHRSLVEEDRFTRLAFGRSFARAYFEVTSGTVQDD